ncbi:MAG: discoidin domain-containing protein [Thermoguttaceae bacterium]
MQTSPAAVRWFLAGLLAALLAVGAKAILAAAPSDPVSLQALVEADWVQQDELFTPSPPRGTADAPAGVTTADDASGGCDGVKNGRWGFHTASGETDPWWQVDLGGETAIDRIVVFNRTDGKTAARTRNLRISVARDGKTFQDVYAHGGESFYGVKEGKPLVVDLRGKGVAARIVRLSVPGKCSFALDEVEVYGSDDPRKNLALGRPADQKSVGPYSCPGTLPEGVDRAEPPRPAAAGFTLAHTGRVLDRAARLAQRLRTEAFAANLAEMRGKLAALQSAASPPLEARRELYFNARRLLRKIAFTNPLLDFDRILFVKRHDSGGVFHMCDQYYGCNGVPGGGLFVLDDPFGDRPSVRDLLAGSVVEKGRLAGQRLVNGAFLSPEVSFDGEEILFAFSECRATETYQWGPDISYHIFRVRADGSGLVQLTDGPWNDFDPCYLPNGRIVFVSERRGGYLRCGRHCPVYTMHSMEPDGSDIICLSFHETHEWHPSVNNDGMLVYTRWDYVDRDTNIAHHIWTCYPDGRDPRSFHGNYPDRRESRPWMEMNIRAIPGSNKYVFSTGAHHGHEFGSLALLDPRLEDNGAMSQLERLTPEVPFPEAEARDIQAHMIYGTPWPLAESDYLCVYDAEAKNRGIYWIDRDGNRELLYRDGSISCASPIPLRARVKPPVIPSGTLQAARDARGKSPGEMKATVAVMNVYESDFTWPEGAKVAALRVIQVLPKTTAPPNEPRIGIADQTNARLVLGSVPVEEDGSVFFEAPAGKEIYFQAIDGRGMAIQSMRSGTYLHPGERLQCQGCHERKHRPPVKNDRLPLALQRPPSKLAPEVEGSNPFSFVRMVQPVLDRNCVQCHREKKALDLAGARGGKYGWTKSYENLAGKYGFYYHVSNGSIKDPLHGGSRTIAGEFGARASALLEYLGEGHYGVKLSDEDFRRVALWLDLNSEFYGSYENNDAQARGEIVLPTLD